MKAIVRIGLWKAIAFLAIIFLFLFTACDDDPVLLKPSVVITSIKDVTTNEAVIVVSVVPNEETTVSLEYFETLHPEIKVNKILPTKYQGTESVSLVIPLVDLKPSTNYDFIVTALSTAGSAAKNGTFKTYSLTKSEAVIKPATKITRFEATLNATIIPKQDDTKVTFKYWTEVEKTPKSKTLTSLYQGNDSINVSVDVNQLPLGTKIYYQVELDNKAGLVLSDNSVFETFAVVDYDGNLYHTVTIGTQTWLKENLKTTHYANGDPISNVGNANNWDDINTGAYCQYNNDPKIAEVYGNLYNFYVGTDPRGLIIGWHTPTSAEFATLGNYLADGVTYKAGPMMMETGNVHWLKTNPYFPPTNSSGFTALPNGAFAHDMGASNWIYMNLGDTATFWTVNSEGLINAGLTEISSEYGWLSLAHIYQKTIYCGLRLLKTGSN